jgi:signal transduction histidine kinase
MAAASDPKSGIDIPVLCRPAVEASPIPTLAVEGAGYIVRYVNTAFRRLTGKTKEELIGNAFCGIVPATDECLSLLDRVYRTGRAETHTGQEPSASDNLYWSYAMWPILACDRHPAGVMIQVMETVAFHRQAAAVNEALLIGSVRQHELTEAANEQLRAELKKRQHAEEILRRANDDLKQFAFAAAHDLKEPLRIVSSYSQLLVKRYRDRLDNDASRFMDQIRTSTERIGQLLDDLLSYTRLSAEEEEEEEPEESVDLNLIFRGAVQNLKIPIEESQATVTSGALPSVYGHAAHFMQLFQNLIANAIKYHGTHSPRIHVSAEERNGEWQFAVADNGIGIAPRYHEQIFGIFKRLHGNDIPGTGIGLAICRWVVERRGGRIWVESEENQGTTFYFTLPLASPETF